MKTLETLQKIFVRLRYFSVKTVLTPLPPLVKGFGSQGTPAERRYWL